MPNVYKGVMEDAQGNSLLWGTVADIVTYDSKNAKNLDSKDTQDAITKINNKAEAKADTLTLTTTIVASAFIGNTAPYTQKINLDGVKASDNPLVGVIFSDTPTVALEQQDSWSSVSRIQTGDGYILISCYEDKPAVNIPIQVKIVR